MTVISGTAKSKAQIWDLFAHGEYFQPHRALIKHWIQKWIITKEENCKGWNFHFFTHYLTWLLLPPFGTKPLRAEQNNNSSSFPRFQALEWSPGVVPPPPTWWSWRWWATPGSLHVVVDPANRPPFLPPTPPRAPPSQVNFMTSLLRDVVTSIAQHCTIVLERSCFSQANFLPSISHIASSRPEHLPFHFFYSLERALLSFGLICKTSKL